MRLNQKHISWRDSESKDFFPPTNTINMEYLEQMAEKMKKSIPFSDLFSQKRTKTISSSGRLFTSLQKLAH